MKYSTSVLLSVISSIIILIFIILLTAKTSATPIQADNFIVTFEEHPDLDQVCFDITLKNNQDFNDNIQLNLILNRTNLDITKTETMLWEEEEYEYDITFCNSCEIESCAVNNVTNKSVCMMNSVTDCGLCGIGKKTVTGTKWNNKELLNSEREIFSLDKSVVKEYEKNKLSNWFENTL